MITYIKLCDGSVLSKEDNPTMFEHLSKALDSYRDKNTSVDKVVSIEGVLSHDSQRYSNTGIGEYTVTDMRMFHKGCGTVTIEFRRSPKIDSWLMNTIKQRFGISFLDIIKYDCQAHPYVITFIMAITVKHGVFGYNPCSDTEVRGAGNVAVICQTSEKQTKEISGYIYPETNYIHVEK